MFRGDARHTGVFAGEGVGRLGGVRWQFHTSGPVRSSPTVLGTWLWVGSSDGTIYALDRSTGAELWHVDVGSPVNSTPAVAAGLVVFGARDGTFYAIDARSGRERWRFETGALMPWEWGLEGWDAYTSSPVVSDSVVLFGAGDGLLYALDLSNGEEMWRFETQGRIRSSPAVADGVAFVGSADGWVYAVDLASGRERWRHAPEGVSLVSADFGFDRKSIIASPAVAGGTVYVGSRDGHMYALDQATGERKWRADHRVSWAMSSPAVLGDVLYSGTSDGAFLPALDVASGNEIWRFVAEGYTWSSPAVVGDGVYIGDGSGNLSALDRATGEPHWSFRAGGAVLSSPVVADGVVYFGSDDGNVYALDGEGRYPHLAVFWDADLRNFTTYQSDVVVRSYFAERGYRVLNVVSLDEFMAQRIEDREPSVVVFAMDHVPSSVAAAPSDSTLFRRYLNADGKVVWLGLPPMLLTRDPSTGDVTALNREGGAAFLDVDFASTNFDTYGAAATPLGAEWGAPASWMSSTTIEPSGGLEVLGLDENGLAAAWVKSYGDGGAPGTGFVGLTTNQISFDDLPGIRAIAEYGIVGGERNR